MTEQTPPVPRLVKIVPPVWIVLLSLIGVGVSVLFPSREWFDWQFKPATIILSSLGLTLIISAGNIFRKRGTEIVPASPTNKLLIIDGPFKLSRNPMYLGMTMVLLGVAFYAGTLPMFLVPVAFFCLINFVFIPFEEAKMLRQFGAEYSDYKRRVRRWI